MKKVWEVIKKILTSPVFITYVVLILLSLLNIKLPQLVLDLTTTMGNANAFLAMLCIGILFQFKLKKEDWKIVFKVLSLRVVVCSLISMFIYFVIPLHKIYLTIAFIGGMIAGIAAGYMGYLLEEKVEKLLF